MRTLRELLSVDAHMVIDVSEAPSYIHSWDFDENDDDVVLSWTDEGEIFEESFPLDEPPPANVKVYRLEQLQ